MEVIKTLQPGANGTKRLQRQWQEKLVAVRYRRDKATNTLYTTVEIVVDQRTAAPSHNKPAPYFDFETVGVRVHFDETQLRQKVKQAGGQWNKENKLWEISYGEVRRMGLEQRIVADVSEY